jgi:hypothetical protein
MPFVQHISDLHPCVITFRVKRLYLIFFSSNALANSMADSYTKSIRLNVQARKRIGMVARVVLILESEIVSKKEKSYFSRVCDFTEGGILNI